MAEMKTDMQHKTCPACGAPVVAEICAYCGSATGLNTAAADMEYPVLECKEATLNFWTTVFPMIFAVSFGMPGVGLLIAGLLGYGEGVLLITGLPFFLIGAVALSLVLRTVSRYVKVKKHGTRIRGKVYGYMDDNVTLNGRPAQVVKLLIQTSNGPRFILYQLGSTMKLYGVQDTIDILMYENYFMICKNRF